MPATLESLLKGHEFPPAQFELTADWVRGYVAAVEDDAIGALGDALVPPMAVAALSVRALLEAAGLPAGATHVAQELDFHRPAKSGERLRANARIASRGVRAGWVLMGIDLTVDDGSRALVMDGRATITFPVGEAA